MKSNSNFLPFLSVFFSFENQHTCTQRDDEARNGRRISGGRKLRIFCNILWCCEDSGPCVYGTGDIRGSWIRGYKPCILCGGPRVSKMFLPLCYRMRLSRSRDAWQNTVWVQILTSDVGRSTCCQEKISDCLQQRNYEKPVQTQDKCYVSVHAGEQQIDESSNPFCWSSVLQCVEMCCSALKCAAVFYMKFTSTWEDQDIEQGISPLSWF